jgi:hypothetical protein
MRTINREKVEANINLESGSNMVLFTDGSDLGDKYSFKFEKETDKAIMISVEAAKWTYSTKQSFWIPKSILKKVSIEAEYMVTGWMDGQEVKSPVYYHLYIVPMWFKTKNNHYFKNASF